VIELHYTLSSNFQQYVRELSALQLVEVEVTLQPTVSQSLCQDIEPTLGLVNRYYFLSESLVSVGCPL
jgi:hypothetical protein